jgi:hypothetical protein
MKVRFLSILVLLISFSSCIEKQDIIKVGVFDRNGGSPWCITDAVEACKIDPQIEVDIISAAEIMSEKLDEYDLIVFPGGGGTSETNSLGNKGVQRIIDMVVKEGKGVVGICAGSYILSDTPDYTCFALSGVEAIDIEHDHRGNGLAKFTLTSEGLDIFPELKNQDTLFCQYYEGPVLIKSKNSEYKYTSLATMESDVHLIEGTPSNMTNNKPFITITECGKGRVASFVGHPECTPGMRWMLPRLIRWTLNKELISYNIGVVRPALYSKEILYTKEQKALMNKYYKNLKGSKEEIVVAIDELIKMSPWSAKKWMEGLIRHNAPEVRLAAGNAVERLERTDAIPDLESAISIEKDLKVKVSLEGNLVNLKKMINK